MSDPRSRELSVAKLRQAFDASFALPFDQPAPALEDLLAIRVAGDPYVIRLHEIAGVVAVRKVVFLPAANPELLGLAGIRGGIVPVFGLAGLIGYGAVADTPRWLILCGREEPLAFAFQDLEGHLRLPTSSFHAEPSATRRFVTEVVRTESAARAVIGMPLVVTHIRNRAGRVAAAKEQ